MTSKQLSKTPLNSLSHHSSRISDSSQHKTMSKKQDLNAINKNKKFLKNSPSSSSPSSSGSYLNSSSSGTSVRKDLATKEDKTSLEVFNNANFAYFPNHISASIGDSFYTGTASSFPCSNNVQQQQNQQHLQQDPNHIYYQNQGFFTPNNYNETYSSGAYSGQQIQHQQQSMQQHMQQQSHCYPGSQQQYYYYPTPESSPDVQFQLLNEAAVLNAATQHLLANSTSQSSFNLLPATNITNNFSNNGINIAKRSVNSNDVSASSSNASSTSPSPSESAGKLGYGNTGVFNYQNTNQIQVSDQSLPVARVPNPESQTLTSPTQNAYQSYSTYPSQIQMESESVSTVSSNSAKMSQNWYLSAAAEAVAAQQNNSFNYTATELSGQSSPTVNSYSNFQQKF